MFLCRDILTTTIASPTSVGVPVTHTDTASPPSVTVYEAHCHFCITSSSAQIDLLSDHASTIVNFIFSTVHV